MIQNGMLTIKSQNRGELSALIEKKNGLIHITVFTLIGAISLWFTVESAEEAIKDLTGVIRGTT